MVSFFNLLFLSSSIFLASDSVVRMKVYTPPPITCGDIERTPASFIFKSAVMLLNDMENELSIFSHFIILCSLLSLKISFDMYIHLLFINVGFSGFHHPYISS